MGKFIKEWKSKYQWNERILADDRGEAEKAYYNDDVINDEKIEDLLNTCIANDAMGSLDAIAYEIYNDNDMGESLEFDSEKGARYGDIEMTYGNTVYSFHVWDGHDFEMTLEDVQFRHEKPAKLLPKSKVWKDICKRMKKISNALNKYLPIIRDNDLCERLSAAVKTMEHLPENDIPDEVYKVPEGIPEKEYEYFDASKYDQNGNKYSKESVKKFSDASKKAKSKAKKNKEEERRKARNASFIKYREKYSIPYHDEYKYKSEEALIKVITSDNYYNPNHYVDQFDQLLNIPFKRATLCGLPAIFTKFAVKSPGVHDYDKSLFRKVVEHISDYAGLKVNRGMAMYYLASNENGLFLLERMPRHVDGKDYTKYVGSIVVIAPDYIEFSQRFVDEYGYYVRANALNESDITIHEDSEITLGGFMIENCEKVDCE
jgi:hypothetical protein